MIKKNDNVISKGIAKAKEVLEENSVVSPPVRIEEIIENYEIKAFEKDFKEKYADIAGIIDIERKTIYVNKNDSSSRKVFTIAHELGHWLLHKEELKEKPQEYAILPRKPIGRINDDPIEKQANAFAAHLLVPKKLLKEYSEEIKRRDIHTIAKIFGVSYELIRYRIKQEGLNV